MGSKVGTECVNIKMEIWVVYTTDVWGNMREIKGFFDREEAIKYSAGIEQSDNIFKHYQEKSIQKIEVK